MSLDDTCSHVPAARMLEAMNKSIDPCQDFYEFACGGWIYRNPIPQNQAFWDRLGFLREQLSENLRTLLEESDQDYDPKSVKLARALYRTCMNTSKTMLYREIKIKEDEIHMFLISLAGIEVLGMKPIHDTLIKLGLSKYPPTGISNQTTDVSWLSGAAQRMLGLNLLIQFTVSEDIQDTSKNTIKVRLYKLERDFDFFMIVFLLYDICKSHYETVES